MVGFDQMDAELWHPNHLAQIFDQIQSDRRGQIHFLVATKKARTTPRFF
jgi:hypothetical protein